MKKYIINDDINTDNNFDSLKNSDILNEKDSKLRKTLDIKINDISSQKVKLGILMTFFPTLSFHPNISFFLPSMSFFPPY